MPESPTTRFALIGPSGADNINTGDDIVRAILAILEAKAAGFLTPSTYETRPAAAAGNAHKVHIATDNGVVGISTGSAWVDINPKDAEAVTASLRTLGTGAAQAAAGNHNHNGVYQPLDADLTAIAGVTTDPFGRALLALATAAQLRSAAGLGALATLSAVGSAQITDGSIATGDIGDGQVTPAKRSTAVQASTTGSGTLTTPGDTSEVNCLNVALTGTGRPVLVNWSVIANNANSGANRAAGARLRLDSSTIIGLPHGVDLLLNPGDTSREQISGTGIITPSAGSHTFGLYVNSSAGGAVDFRDGEITVIEL